MGFGVVCVIAGVHVRLGVSGGFMRVWFAVERGMLK